MGALVHVVAIEIHAGLEAQRVPGTETAGSHTGGIQRLPNPLRLRRGQHDLEPVLAGVAGARDKPTVYLASEERLESERRRRPGG